MPENLRKLDEHTVERLLTARLAPEDAPPGYRAVAVALHDAAALPASVKADELISTMAEIATSQPPPTTQGTRSMNAKHLSFRAVGAAFAAVALSATAAAATTGSLPDAAQAGLANAASHAGITLPNPHSNHSDKSDRGNETSTDAPGNEAPAGDKAQNEHGNDVSETARNTDADGRDKGQEISSVARDGHGTTPPAANGDGTDAQAPVSTPNAGGTDTADNVSNDGASTNGTDHAPDAAANGSLNAGDHPTPDNHPGSGNKP